MLYTPLIEAVMLFNKSKLVGKLLRISVENIASCRGLDDSHWFWDKQLSGGIFIEHGVHFFDWCGRLAGDPKKVLALAHTTGKRENKVFASVEHSGGTIASYYHAFVVDSQEERTRVVLSYESVDVILEGWIPTRLRMSGHHAALATTTIRRMMRRTVDSVPDTESGFAFDAGQKQAIYKEGLRAAAEDVAMAIREPSHVPQCDARKALVSLRVAIAATNSADTGAAVELDLTKTRARP
jgi:predicted dehydrogenase